MTEPLSPALLAAMADRMNRLEFVEWDRCVLLEGTGSVYGWVRRDDGRSDFVRLEFAWGTTTGLDGQDVEWFGVGFTTSSAEWSPRIPGLLYSGTDAEVHNECQRIEHVFGGLVRRAIIA